MNKKKKGRSKRDDDWARAKRLCRLSVEDVQMAKELGMNPRKLVKNIPNKSEPWKAPVKIWIRELYRKLQEKQAKKREQRKEVHEPDTETLTESTRIDEYPQDEEPIPL